MRIGVLTGGGDCPGLNAVIRAIARKGERVYGDEIVGFLHRAGAQGFLDKQQIRESLAFRVQALLSAPNPA
mgnify:CR=1 FL=1